MNFKISSNFLSRYRFYLLKREKQRRPGHTILCACYISSKVQSNSDYCIDIVRKFDFENFLCTLLFKKSVRQAAFAVRAFNVETAQVRDVVTDKERGIGRLIFWKDAIEQIYKDHPPSSPVALELAKAVKKYKLSKRWLTRLVDARIEQLSDAPYKNTQHLEESAENLVASILYLLLEIHGVKTVNADHAASHIGKCQGIITLLRGLPFNAARGLIYFPVDVLMKHSVSQESLRRGKEDQNIKDSIYDIASLAHQHLDIAQSFRKDVPSNALPVFLVTAICKDYLKNLQKADFNVFHPSLQHRNNLLPWHLLIQKLKRTY